MAVLGVAALSCGCASDPFSAPGAARYPRDVELEATPFFPQEKYQCGPAALATVLVQSGVTVTPAALVSRVYLPARHGSLQPEIVATARHYERIPYVIEPAFPALLDEVAAGRPVLVLQNLGIAVWPVWHYAVVVGFSPSSGEIVLRSGEDRRRVTPAGVFMRTWARSDYWGMSVLAPGELPAGDDPTRFLSAVAGLESTGHPEAAATAWRAAVERWPGNHIAWLGLGNTAWAAGRAQEAEAAYRRAAASDPPDAVALNNLASVIATQGRCREARDVMRRAIAAAAGNASLRDALAATESEIDACEPR